MRKFKPIDVCARARINAPSAVDMGARTTDKWRLYEDVVHAARDLGLRSATLQVLRALLTFFRPRELSVDADAVVFPSNRTLSERAGGMPESTLRRHLSSLVMAGLITRRDSPNGKRYARRVAGNVRLAFGFDLSALARMAEDLSRMAHDRHLREERIELVRCELRCAMGELPIDHPLRGDLARLLRRRSNEKELRAALMLIGSTSSLEQEHLPNEPIATDSSGGDDRNERHIQKTDDAESVSLEMAHDASIALREDHHAAWTFFPRERRDWNGILRVSDALAPMLAIERSVMAESRKAMGPMLTAVIIFMMVNRQADVRNPGGYLRRLTQKFRCGTLDVKGLIYSQRLRTREG